MELWDGPQSSITFMLNRFLGNCCKRCLFFSADTMVCCESGPTGCMHKGGHSQSRNTGVLVFEGIRYEQFR